MTASESGSEDSNTEESDDNQYTDVHLAATAEDFLMPPKRARTTGGPSRNLNQSKDEPNIVKQIQFTADPGLKINMESEKPSDFFKLFVTEELINTMVVETNRFATQEINKQRPLRRSSRFKDWKPISSKDMRQFLGVLLHMGCVKMPSLEHYWSKSSLYRFPLFSRIMSRNKFQLILRFWHFINNEDSGSGRLCKIIGLLDHLNNAMENIYCPNKNISIDESMMLWKGPLVFRQYVKNKRQKYGIKFYELCESDGILLKVKIYSGETTFDKHLLGQTGAIVLDLMEKFLGKGYHLYTDSFYNSFELTKHTINQKTYICGTLRTDQKSNPKDCTKAKLKQGDVISRSREGVVVAKWREKREVLMISILHSLQMIEVTNRREENETQHY